MAMLVYRRVIFFNISSGRGIHKLLEAVHLGFLSEILGAPQCFFTLPETNSKSPWIKKTGPFLGFQKEVSSSKIPTFQFQGISWSDLEKHVDVFKAIISHFQAILL